jgi:hypothetical protein
MRPTASGSGAGARAGEARPQGLPERPGRHAFGGVGSLGRPFLGKRSLPARPQHRVERVPGPIPGARTETVAGTGHGPRLDHADGADRPMAAFTDPAG